MKPPSLYSAEGWNSIIGVELLLSFHRNLFLIFVSSSFSTLSIDPNLYRRSTIIATFPLIFFSMIYSLAKKGSLENVLSHGLGTIRTCALF